jgi:4-amino-4-deoxy-L-arabinose transferase-like glycosyltransferase
MTGTRTNDAAEPLAQDMDHGRAAMAEDPRWVRPALFALLLLTAVAYVWKLSHSGDGNSFYAAAVLAGTKSWKAFFFGSLDSSSFISVDKPPASLWLMELSGRIFGFGSWSMLVPQALEGVAAVGLLYAAVKRWFGPLAGLGAGALLALTPVAALMFRFNEPDALMVTLLLAAAYCLIRALEKPGIGWTMAAGALLGFAFLTKMGEALLVVPAFGLAYLVAAPASMGRRLAALTSGLATLVVACGWWVAIVALLPASSRPLIDGSGNDSIFNLIFGYNGLHRLLGSGPGGGTGGPSYAGAAGPLRLFNPLMGGQASWLLPAALIALVVGAWSTRAKPRTDRTRAALILWGGWLIVAGGVFSFSQGIIHPYYDVALAPPIAALVAIGGRQLWRRRDNVEALLLAGLTLAVTAGWSYVLLDRTPSWHPVARAIVLAAAVIALAAGLLAHLRPRLRGRSISIVVAGAAAIACLAGPAGYTASTIAMPQNGALVAAGPPLPGPEVGGSVPAGQATPPTSGPLIAALEANASSYRWVAATIGSWNTAAEELASGGDPIMAIGGFNNNGGEISLARFVRYVQAGRIHYFVPSGFGGTGALGTSPIPAEITAWVRAHRRPEKIGGVTVFDLAT